MKVLGICCGGRPMGNNELMVKHALKVMQDAGATTRITRLQDWNIGQCNGCFSCIFKNKDCPIKDDLQAFIDLVFEQDRVLVSAPTYVLFPPGSVKVVLQAPPLAPEVSSNSHPDPAAWYPVTTAQLSWRMPSDLTGIAGFRMALDEDPTTAPSSSATAEKITPLTRKYPLCVMIFPLQSISAMAERSAGMQVPLAALIQNSSVSGTWSVRAIRVF